MRCHRCRTSRERAAVHRRAAGGLRGGARAIAVVATVVRVVVIRLGLIVIVFLGILGNGLLGRRGGGDHIVVLRVLL
eukprot:7380477-Prymnesium_polylepis.2